MKYYAFDWDDNILFMPTKIKMEELVDGEWVKREVSTSKFAEIRKDENWRYDENSFINFRDSVGKNVFFKDSAEAIKNGNFGPSWNNFIKCITSASLFIIITARGHSSKNIRKVVEYIISDVLTNEQKSEMYSNLIAFEYFFNPDYDITKSSPKKLLEKYLNICQYVGVSSPEFKKKFKLEGGVAKPEKSKIIVMEQFMERINKYTNKYNIDVKFGFSDDDKATISNIQQHFKGTKDFYNIMMSIFDTSDPEYVKRTDF